MGNSMKAWLKALAIVSIAMAGCDDGDDPVNEGDMMAGEGGAGGEGGMGGGAGGGEGGMGGGVGGQGGGEGGMGGGVGGEGGEGGEGGGGEECAGIDLKDLNADGVEADGAWSFDVSTGAEDQLSGSCQDADAVPGGDVMVKFVPPEGGLWLFTANVDGAPAPNTLVYAYSDCNDAFTEASCQAGGRLALEVVAGQPVYIVVDSTEGTDPIAVTFRAEVAQATAPTLETVEASFNADNGQLGLRYDGTDPESDVNSFIIDLFGEDGASLLDQPVPIQLDPEGNPESLVQADGMFQGEIILNADGLGVIAGVRITMVDLFSLESNSVDVAPTAPEQILELGAECNFAGVFEACMPEDACSLVNPDDEAPVCIVATAPVLTAGRVFVTGEATIPVDIGQVELGDELYFSNAIGIELEGSDVEDNAAFADVTLIDAEGADIPTGNAGEPLRIGLDFVPNEDGSWVARGVATVINPCAERAVGVFNPCAEAGGEQAACLADARVEFEACTVELVGSIAGARVAAGDETLRISEPLLIEEALPTPDANEGDLCGPFEAFGACQGEELLCYGVRPASAQCLPVQTECLEGTPTIELPAEGDGPWAIEGDHTGAEGLFGAGSCGGGVSQLMYTFTAPAAGTYAAATSGLGENTDTLLHARTHCNLGDAEYELACNDDVEMGNLASAITFDAEAGQTVYIIADTWVNPETGGSFPGPFTLTVTAQ